MNPRIRKEFRSLLPIVCVTPVVVVAPSLIWPKDGDGLGTGILLFVVCYAAMAASSFGNEFHWRTMPLLLAQPIFRQKLWFEKLLALGIACLVAILFCLIALLFLFTLFGGYQSFWPTLSSFGLTGLSFILCAICATPYLTLLSRNTVGGLVFSLVIPQFILAAISIVQRYVFISTTATFLVYAGCTALFYWLGYRKFLNLQVLDGIDQSFQLPRSVENAFAVPFQAVFAGHSGPIASLIKKEFRLQQANITIAALLFGLATCAVFWVWRFHKEEATMFVVAEWLVLVFIFPPLVGAVAVIEEKAWGLAESQLTLPVSARKQWLAKMVVTFSTSLALGLALPFLIMLAHHAFTGSNEFVIQSDGIGFLFVVLFNLLLTSIAVYAASISTNAIRAIFLAFGLATATALAVAAGRAIGTGWEWFSRPPYGGVSSVFFGYVPEYLQLIGTLFGLGVLFYLFQRLAFLNFKRQEATISRAVVHMLAIMLLIILFVAVFSTPA